MAQTIQLHFCTYRKTKKDNWSKSKEYSSFDELYEAMKPHLKTWQEAGFATVVCYQSRYAQTADDKQQQGQQ